MINETFWCDYELRRFPISELGRDDQGNPIHVNSGPLHYLNGNLVHESHPSLIPLTNEEQIQVYNEMPDQYKI